jgi:peptidase E
MSNENKRVLLLSTSRLYGSGYLDHAEDEIRSFLGNRKRVLFVPFAIQDHDGYASARRSKTTNDMPIVQPPSFNALALVQFQINPHYLDPDPNSKHMGETREERILQFLEENDTPVVGLREGAILRIENGETILRGSAGARIFRKGFEPIEVLPGARLGALLSRG